MHKLAKMFESETGYQATIDVNGTEVFSCHYVLWLELRVVSASINTDNLKLLCELQEAVGLLKTFSAINYISAIFKINECIEQLRAKQRNYK
jgi:hypothetical protein